MELKLYNPYNSVDNMPIDIFFKEANDFSDLVNMALSHCRVNVLDIGAAASAHVFFLQSFGTSITALDSSHGCIDNKTLGREKRY